MRLPHRPAVSLAVAACLAVPAATSLAGVAAAGPAARGGSAAGSAAGRVTIVRTAYGIPHITAHSFGGLGYGFGYAFASDNLCTMAADYVTVEGLRSKYFGPNGSYTVEANGTTINNLDSDIFWRGIQASHILQQLLAVRHGPGALGRPLRQLLAGYTAGYNHYLASVGGYKHVPDPTCRGRSWVRPITENDAFLRLYQLLELASQDVVIDGIANAEPPSASNPAGSGTAVADPAPGTAGMPTLGQLRSLGARLRAAGIGGVSGGTAGGVAGGMAGGMAGGRLGPTGAMGSNAIAVGSAGNRDHRHGLLLGNPHFPWAGTERFYEAQLTIPGRLNVEGATLYGVPLILIGFTKSMAWSHTVSTAYRFTPYQLTLVPGKPTEYVYNGHDVAMTHRTVTVQERGGHLVHHTLWYSRYGPVFDNLVGVPLPWTDGTAFAMADANARNFRVFNHFLHTDEAQSTRQELYILKKYEGIPWVNTLVSDRSGQALYADIGAIPNVTDAKARKCDTALGAATFKADRLPILDGSRAACNWATNKDSVAPGIFGADEEPYLLRRDYVENSNDSFWLSNPKHPLTGYPLIIGDTDTARSLRTRSALTMIAQRLAGTDGLGRPGFTRTTMQELFFSDRQYGAELVRKQLVAMCRSFPGGKAPTSSGGPQPVGTSCSVLAHWHNRENEHSRGAVLFRDFWERALALQEGPWSHPFNSAHPVSTPYGLNTSDPRVKQAFGDALADLRSVHLPFDVALGTVQYVVRHHKRIPLPGGPGDPDGEFNAIYQDVVHHPGQTPSIGSSYIQVVTWHAGQACPDDRTLLSYSESTNPTSRHFADQTWLFSKKRWVAEPFCPAAVRRDAVSTVRLVVPKALR
jgi:acyl-homoserine-lactone acylase